MPWWNVAGSLLSSAGSFYAANQAWKHQKEYAMNAHQWEVEDLKKAGLNPILSAGGSGAPMTSAPMASIENPFANFSATQIAKKQAKADIANKDSGTKQNEANTRLANANADSIVQQTGQERELFQYKKDKALWEVKTAEQNYINATKMPEVYASNIAYQNSASAANKANTRRGEAELPFWQSAGEVISSAVDWVRRKIEDKEKLDQLSKEFSASNHRYDPKYLNDFFGNFRD